MIGTKHGTETADSFLGMVGKRCMCGEGVAEAYLERMRVTMQA
jgi:hypothetical protein